MTGEPHGCVSTHRTACLALYQVLEEPTEWLLWCFRVLEWHVPWYLMVLVLSVELQICSHVLEQTREMRSCWSPQLSSPGVLADFCCSCLLVAFSAHFSLAWNDVCQSSGLLWTSAAEVAPISLATGPKAGLILAQCFAQQCCTQDWKANVTCTSATPECFLSSGGPLRSVFSSDRVYWLPLWCPAWPDAVSVLSGYNQWQNNLFPHFSASGK